MDRLLYKNTYMWKEELVSRVQADLCLWARIHGLLYNWKSGGVTISQGTWPIRLQESFVCTRGPLSKEKTILCIMKQIVLWKNVCLPAGHVCTEKPSFTLDNDKHLSQHADGASGLHSFCRTIRGQWPLQFDETPVDKRTMGRQSLCLCNFAIEWEARVNETNASGD